jgi:hypothetical protein
MICSIKINAFIHEPGPMHLTPSPSTEERGDLPYKDYIFIDSSMLSANYLLKTHYSSRLCFLTN